MANTELLAIIEKFAACGWDLIDAPARAWLSANRGEGTDEAVTAALIDAVRKADALCGSCGCEFDPLYKKALTLLQSAS